MNSRIFLSLTLLAPVLVLGCIYYVDYPLALWVEAHIRAQHDFNELTRNLPSKLLTVDMILTTMSFAGYFYLRLKNVRNRHRHFFLLTGMVLPIAYVTKQMLKSAFGRIETRLWIENPHTHMQTWFNTRSWGFDGFPSGHMLVFTALFMALWCFYPHYRKVYVTVLGGLALALLATNYHFLGDVVAGTYIGLLLYTIVHAVVMHEWPRRQD